MEKMARTHFSKDSFCFESLWHNAESFLSRAPRHSVFFTLLCVSLVVAFSRSRPRHGRNFCPAAREEFSLPDHEENARALPPKRGARGLLIFTPQVPIVKRAFQIKALRDEFAAKGSFSG